MPASISCDQCETKLKVPNPIPVGQLVRCPRCKVQFRVKALLSSAVEEPDDETLAQESPRRELPSDGPNETRVGRSLTAKAPVTRPEAEDEEEPQDRPLRLRKKKGSGRSRKTRSGKLPFIIGAAVLTLLVLGGGIYFANRGSRGRAHERAATGEPTIAEANLIASANQIIDAILKKDHARLADLTLPKVVELTGGKNKFVRDMDSSLKQMGDEGFSFVSFTIGKPSQIVASQGMLYVVVPYTGRMGGPNNSHCDLRAYLIGMSADDGRTWKFLDGNGPTSDPDMLKQLLPNFPAQLSLPSKQQPVWVKDEAAIGKLYESKEGQYRVAFPGEPSLMDQTEDGTLAHIAVVVSHLRTFMVSYANITDEKLGTAESKELLDKINREMLDPMHSKIISSKDIVFGADKLPCRDFVAELEGRTIRFRVILSGKRMYQISVVASLDFVTGLEADKFMDSFEILK